ncbi:MAG TPA: Tim44/TimA family putative adaptor protein [Azospirillaceae bacterium]|nr:Tim44/TimA family putative adaptor protein [Azospirillaceae bacterium]
MGGGLEFIDILIFAMIAAFLVYRLRSVLGRRHGEERQRPNPFSPPSPQPVGDSNVVTLPQRAGLSVPQPAPGEPVSLAQGLALIRQADPAFDEKHFLDGARGAFEMIVGAFAQGDPATLRPLLADEVYGNFVQAIEARRAAGETLETRIVKFDDVDISAARMDGPIALVTLRFATQQTSVLRDHAGNILDGDSERPAEVIDIWTFARDTRTQDPNWQLIETRIPG